MLMEVWVREPLYDLFKLIPTIDGSRLKPVDFYTQPVQNLRNVLSEWLKIAFIAHQI